jgi:hypothetical protein
MSANEPPELRDARRHLAAAERTYDSETGLARLIDGLALLEDVIATGSAEHAGIARNLASTYSETIYGRIKRRLEAERALPEPELEHLFKVILAFDRSGVALPTDARATKIDVVRRLVDLYYEGQPRSAKEKALAQLTEITGDPD